MEIVLISIGGIVLTGLVVGVVYFATHQATSATPAASNTRMSVVAVSGAGSTASTSGGVGGQGGVNAVTSFSSLSASIATSKNLDPSSTPGTSDSGYQAGTDSLPAATSSSSGPSGNAFTSIPPAGSATPGSSFSGGPARPTTPISSTNVAHSGASDATLSETSTMSGGSIGQPGAKMGTATASVPSTGSATPSSSPFPSKAAPTFATSSSPSQSKAAATFSTSSVKAPTEISSKTTTTSGTAIKASSVASSSGTGSVLWSGSGGLSFYYDIDGAGTCGPANGVTSYAETGGYTECEPDVDPQTIAQRGTDKLVAIASNTLAANMNLCGKKIIITYTSTGKVYDDLFVWDGCEACNSDPHIDMSATEFGTIIGASNCAEGILKSGVTWQVLDEWGATWAESS